MSETATDPTASEHGEMPASGHPLRGAGDGDELEQTDPDEELEAGDGDDDDDEREADDELEDETDAEAVASQPVSGLSEAEIEKQMKKLEQSAATWRRRVSELLGEDAVLLVACELCDPSIPGYHWPADVTRPTDDLHARLLEVLKRPQVPNLRPASDVARCGECDGWGKVETGSRVAEKDWKKCRSCVGYGYVPPPSPTAAVVGELFPVEVPAAVEEPSAPLEDYDSWGSPRYLPDGQDNPNWGRMPQYKSADLP